MNRNNCHWYLNFKKITCLYNVPFLDDIPKLFHYIDIVLNPQPNQLNKYYSYNLLYTNDKILGLDLDTKIHYTDIPRSTRSSQLRGFLDIRH